MTKVIKGEFEKLETLKINDVSLTCDTSLEIFHDEFNRLSRMDNDLFTYEVEVANIPCNLNGDDDLEQQMSHEANDDMGYDPSDVEFTEWLASKNFNYKTMHHYTKKELWIYWIRGDDEVELTDEESSNSDDEDKVAEVFRIDTNVFDFETRMCKAFNEFNYLLQIDPNLLLRILKDLRLTKNIRMIGYISGIKICHGYMKDHGQRMKYGRNQHQLNIIASLLIIIVDVRSGLPVAGEKMDIVMEETNQQLT
ncbi:hypothetical protein Tco_0490146 [Tanacetum coccineum]